MPKKTPKEKPTSVPCPFTILVDTNEYLPQHNGFRFEHIESKADTDYLPFDIKVETRNLNHLGDYSAEFPGLAPFEQPIVMVERKSAADLFGSVTDRKNFEWRLEMMDQECEFAVVVVESSLESMAANPPPRTEQTFTVVNSSIMSWQMRYQRVHWMFAPDRDWAQLYTFWYLHHFWRNLGQHKLDRDRKRANGMAFLEGIKAHRKKAKVTDCPHKREHVWACRSDYWVRGWLDSEAIALGKPLNNHELPLIAPENVGANRINGTKPDVR